MSQRSYANVHTDTMIQDGSWAQFSKADPRNEFSGSLSIKEPLLYVFEDAGLQHALVTFSLLGQNAKWKQLRG